MEKFILPNIGEGIDTVSVSEVSVKESQNVKKDEVLFIVETDKASMEIPASFTGLINTIHIQTGDLISPGQHILDYTTDDINRINDDKENEGKADLKEEKPVDIKTNEINIEDNLQHTSINKNKTINQSETMSHATPSIKKLARELGCNISDIKGTGNNNRITKEDVYNYVNNKLGVDKPEKIQTFNSNDFINTFSKYGKLELAKLNKIQKITAERLTKACSSIPHVTQFEEADITELYSIIKLLKKVNKDKNAKVSYLPFFIKAVSMILKDLKIFNTSLSPDNMSLVQKYYYNIGVAVDTEIGLLVPVIKNVDKKSIKTISIELASLADKARSGKLSLEEMSGGCITISSLGHIGGKFFTPIINPPEVAILGISSIFNKQLINKNKFLTKKILPISLSYDHRVINGADAARFTTMFKEIISNPSKIK